MANILIIYSTTDGHTRSICERLKHVVEQQNHQVVSAFINDEPDIDLEPFDKIVIGASIRYGNHRPQVYQFIKKNQQKLECRPNAFFTVNVVARKPGKCEPESNPYLQKFLKKISWQPRTLAVFAGKISYQKYKFWDRQVIRFIMWITGGPTDPQTVIDYTDWDKVDDFGRLIAEM